MELQDGGWEIAGMMPATARLEVYSGVLPQVRPEPSASDVWGPAFVGAVAVLTALGALAGFGATVTLLTILGLVTALAGIWHPSLGLLGIGVLTTIDPLTRVYLMSGGIFRWNTFNYLLILLTLLSYQQVLRIRDASTLLLIAFIFLMVVHLTFTPALEVGMFNVLNVVAALGILMCHLRVGRDRKMLYWLAIVNGVTAGIGGAVYFLQISSLPEMNKNAWSAFPLTALFSICLAYPFARGGWRGQRALTALAFVNSLWVFFSGSRGAMLINIFCLLFLLASMRTFMQRFWTVALSAAAVLAVFGIFAAQQQFAMHRIEKLFDTTRELESRTSGRSDLAIAGLYLFAANPLGVGTGGFGPAYARLYDDELTLTGQEKLAHSAWIKTMAENGIFGFIMLVAYVGSFAWRGYKQRNRGFLALGILVTLVIGSSFFSREFQSKGIWYMAAGFLAMAEYGCLAGSPAEWRRRLASKSAMQGRRNRLVHPGPGPLRPAPAYASITRPSWR